MIDFSKSQAYLVSVEGEITTIAPNDGKEFELNEVQKAVEGMIEVVWLNDSWIMIVDEEGKYDGKQPNLLATIIAHQQRAISAWDCIVGPVIICPEKMLP